MELREDLFVIPINEDSNIVYAKGIYTSFGHVPRPSILPILTERVSPTGFE